MVHIIMAKRSFYIAGYPIEVFVAGICGGGLLKFCWGLDGVVPKQYLHGSEIEVALRMLFLVALPMFLMIVSIMLYRASTVFRETLSGLKETLYLEASDHVLSNTTEQTIIFVANLLAAAALKSLTKERIVLSALIFVFARFVFWAGYLGGAFVGRTTLRAPGFGMTLTNTFLLLVLNVSTFVNLK